MPPTYSGQAEKGLHSGRGARTPFDQQQNGSYEEKKCLKTTTTRKPRLLERENNCLLRILRFCADQSDWLIEL